ncbi:phosphoglycerate dehydrogenase-like enzyme [Tamaricihabitans halophyticus]|uniref:Phosphoglycerate dehydrogenase-like enzyme n=1 Tax=Tamaricihabitans halophyticus TaxID=1262583 RepID=A0A4R2QQJ8_9PSEU|nr:D-2-hydroxyacid dehydrogenase [Tamaricihabitans halophyticus]TCP51877.1 phosphoglycerate dehydrogenase-like enzyme [Tamaricihabitans halophyticus]
MEQIERLAHVRYTSGDELAEALVGADALFVWDFQSSALERAWHAADRLRWVHIASAGVDPVLFPAMVDSEIPLTNSRGVFESSLAEYVLGVVLAFAKDFATSLELQQQRIWRHRESERIAGTRALVVGTGPIGRAIAQLLRAVGMRVAGIGRRAVDDDPDFGSVYPSDELRTHLPDADYVVAVAPLTPATEGMFNAASFAAMKPTARFINVGRGDLVVTPDLLAALQAKTIAGAALDVFDTEPLPADSPLWSLPNVLISPHMSADVKGWRNALVELFADNVQLWLQERPLRNVVDKQLGYVPTGAAARPAG